MNHDDSTPHQVTNLPISKPHDLSNRHNNIKVHWSYVYHAPYASLSPSSWFSQSLSHLFFFLLVVIFQENSWVFPTSIFPPKSPNNHYHHKARANFPAASLSSLSFFFSLLFFLPFSVNTTLLQAVEIHRSLRILQPLLLKVNVAFISIMTWKLTWILGKEISAFELNVADLWNCSPKPALAVLSEGNWVLSSWQCRYISPLPPPCTPDP